MFQFHKVQLKEQGLLCLGYLLLLFQFHKVQLKVHQPRSFTCSGMFQFHKVQLKEVPADKQVSFLEVSIP